MSEKNLNFDQPVERRGTHSLKYDLQKKEGERKIFFRCGSLIWILRRHLSSRKH